jgi:hypothetical protein
MVKKKQSIDEKFKKNPWIVATIALGLLCLILIFVGGGVGSSKAGNNLVNYFNAQGGGTIEFVSADEFGSSLYEVTILTSEGEEYPAHVTQDGKYWVQLISPLSVEEVEEEVADEGVIPVTDKPLIELFIMTHCPYGTQAEKGFIPTMKILDSVADFKIRFVHYYLHTGEGQEPDETPVQICIREEQEEKFIPYLECFLEGDGVSPYNGNDPETCMQEVGVDKTEVDECISSGRADEYYEIDSQLSKDYGVAGSPTLVVNGVRLGYDSQSCTVAQQDSGECIIYSQGRSSSAYADTTCQAMNEVSELCARTFDSESPSPGFGYTSASGGSTASC